MDSDNDDVSIVFLLYCHYCEQICGCETFGMRKYCPSNERYCPCRFLPDEYVLFLKRDECPECISGPLHFFTEEGLYIP